MRPLGRPRRKWKDNFKISITEIGYEGADWIYLAHIRGSTAESYRHDDDPSGCTK